jgi:hypothetical protein
MKTNAMLNSSDRELFGITIRQTTKEQFLSLTDLQNAYETARWQHGWGERRIDNIMQTDSFKERVFYLLENQGVIKTSFLGFIEMVEKEGIARVLKGLNVYKTTGARQTKQVMANPYIWVLLAMEMNPMIYAKVVVWLTDSLIFNRIECGSNYVEMNKKIKSIIVEPNYPEIAKMINIKVFGEHLSGMRNLASSKELRKIDDIEKQIISAIDMGWIKNENDLYNFLRK